MKFVPLTRVILLELKRNGYNILTSKNIVDGENPIWYPLTLSHVDNYLLNQDCKGNIVPMEEPSLLVTVVIGTKCFE